MKTVWRLVDLTIEQLADDTAVIGDYSLLTDRLVSVTIPRLVSDAGESPAMLRHVVQAVADTFPTHSAVP